MHFSGLNVVHVSGSNDTDNMGAIDSSMRLWYYGGYVIELEN